MIVNKYSGNGGGGGGSYTLPVATANRLGGIKVGSGLTIDAAGVLSTSGGTAPAGGGDYMVVSGLPQTAKEGQLFFVPAHTENILYRTYAFDCSAMHQNEVSEYVLPDPGIVGKSLYYEWSNSDYGWFHWDWGENEHDWVEVPGWGFYKVGEGDYTFYAKFPDSVEVDLSGLNQYVSLDSSVTETVQVDVASATYRYHGHAWFKQRVKVQINDFKGADYGFGSNDNLNGYLSWFSDDELKQTVFEYNGNYARYEGYNEDEQKYTFSVKATNVSLPIGTPVATQEYEVFAYADGSVSQSNDNKSQLPIALALNIADSGFTSTDNSVWVRTCATGSWGGNPIVVKVMDYANDRIIGWTQNVWFRQAYDGNNGDWIANLSEDNRIFGCEFYLGENKIVAEWVVNGEGTVVGGSPINWTVTSVHSAADSTVPSN